MQAIVTEFITFVTCEAQERADNSRRSTLNGDDILYALRVLGLEQYEAVGKIWLARYRIVSGSCWSGDTVDKGTDSNVLSPAGSRGKQCKDEEGLRRVIKLVEQSTEA